MKRAAFASVASVAIMASACQMESPRPLANPAGDFSRSYGVWVSMNHGDCIYWLTDVGLSGSQLTDALRGGYDTSVGIEVLTRRGTPTRCIVEGKASVEKAGFKLVRVRPGTDKDRLSGIPG